MRKKLKEPLVLEKYLNYTQALTHKTSRLIILNMKKSTKKIFISALSTMIDWMDFSIFALLLPMLSKAFFPKNNIEHSYLLSLTLFTAAYLSRPFGGYFFGKISNRLSNESTLRLSTLAMALCSFCTACLPTFKQAGYSGACFFLALRLIQGIIIGGQYPTAFIILSDERKNRYPYLTSNISSIFSYLGIILGQIFIHTASWTMSSQAMIHFGWRVLFLLSASLSMAAYLTQRNLLTGHSKRNTTVNENIFKNLNQDFNNSIFVIIIIFLLGVEFYSATVTIPNQFILEHSITLKQSSLIKAILSIICLISTVFFAYTADIFKLKYSLLIAPSIIILTSCLGIMRLHIDFHTQLLQFSFLALIAVSYSATVSVIYPIITQLFSSNKRNSLVGISYGIGNSASVLVTANLASYYCLKYRNLTPDFLLLSFFSIVFLFYFFMFHRKKLTATH